MDQFQQCRIRRGAAEQTAWLPVRGAKVGASVELLPSREVWDVVEVFEPALDGAGLKELQQLNRRSLPSVEPIR